MTNGGNDDTESDSGDGDVWVETLTNVKDKEDFTEFIGPVHDLPPKAFLLIILNFFVWIHLILAFFYFIPVGS